MVAVVSIMGVQRLEHWWHCVSTIAAVVSTMGGAVINTMLTVVSTMVAP